MTTILNLSLGLFVVPLAAGFVASYVGNRGVGTHAPVALTIHTPFA